MRFVWPWRKQEGLPAVDVEALKTQIRAEVTQEINQEVSRVLLSNSPYPPIPLPTHPQMPIYAWDNPIYFSTPNAPNRRPGLQVTIQTLRNLAENYDILRACIQHLKREVAAVPIKIVLRDGKRESGRAQDRIKQATEFFQTRGGLGGYGKTRREFENIFIEDLCCVGACAIFLHPNRGGGVYAAIPIDASTIRPRVDAYGWADEGKDFEQWIQGRQSGWYSRDEMIYNGLFPRSYTPYYSSPIEWILNVVNAALRADDWNRRWLIDGNIASEVYSLPETWTPDKVQVWAEYWDALLAGESGERQKTKWVPSGTKQVNSHSRKDQDFQQFEQWLMQRVCSIMGVQPASIGYAGQQYKVSQENSMDSTSTFGAGSILDFRKELYDDILERNDYGDLECQNVVQDDTEEPEVRSKRVTLLIAGGVLTVNEGRVMEGLDAIEGGDVLLVPTTLQPLEQALNPPEPTSAPPADPTLSQKPDSQNRAMRAWERKALNRVRAGKPAACAFESEAISETLKADLFERLEQCSTSDDVRGVFRSVQTGAEA